MHGNLYIRVTIFVHFHMKNTERLQFQWEMHCFSFNPSFEIGYVHENHQAVFDLINQITQKIDGIFFPYFRMDKINISFPFK